MAIHFKTKTPKRLLSAYKKAIDEARVTRWSYDEDGDFSHNSDEWRGKAWLRPNIVPNEELVFNILGQKGERLSGSAYAAFHGRIVESFLRYCDSLFTECVVSAMGEEADSFE